MSIVRSIQDVKGLTLTIELPNDFVAKKVEIVVQSLEATETPSAMDVDRQFGQHMLSKPPLNEREMQLFATNPYPLRGLSGKYDDPFRPAAPTEDWEACRDDPA